MQRAQGLTVIEVLTALVFLVVLFALALPLWRTHELRSLRRGAIDTLRAIQAAQDSYFASHARYTAEGPVTLKPPMARYRFELKLAGDALGYVATAHALRGEDGAYDQRCARLSLDQHGRQSAWDDAGKESTADCWYRK